MHNPSCKIKILCKISFKMRLSRKTFVQSWHLKIHLEYSYLQPSCKKINQIIFAQFKFKRREGQMDICSSKMKRFNGFRKLNTIIIVNECSLQYDYTINKYIHVVIHDNLMSRLNKIIFIPVVQAHTFFVVCTSASFYLMDQIYAAVHNLKCQNI